QHFAALRERLVREAQIPAAAADETVRSMQGQVFSDRAPAAVYRAQASSQTPLSNAEVMNRARETARKLGYSRDAAEIMARDVAQARPWLEAQGMLRPGGETANERAFRTFREAAPEIADTQYLRMTPDQAVEQIRGAAPDLTPPDPALVQRART